MAAAFPVIAGYRWRLAAGAARDLAEEILRLAVCEAQAKGSAGVRALETLWKATGGHTAACSSDQRPSR